MVKLTIIRYTDKIIEKTCDHADDLLPVARCGKVVNTTDRDHADGLLHWIICTDAGKVNEHINYWAHAIDLLQNCVILARCSKNKYTPIFWSSRWSSTSAFLQEAWKVS